MLHTTLKSFMHTIICHSRQDNLFLKTTFLPVSELFPSRSDATLTEFFFQKQPDISRTEIPLGIYFKEFCLAVDNGVGCDVTYVRFSSY